jgi:FkbM family methyltransferase
VFALSLTMRNPLSTLNAVFGSWRYILHHPLTRDHRAAAMVRWAKWQVGSRLLASSVVYPFIGGTSLLIEPGMTGATGNVYTGLQDYWEMAFVLHYLRSDDLFVDVGANVGTYSILASGVRGASTLAVEPVPSTFRGLCANVRLNDLASRIEVHNAGLAARPGRLRFSQSEDTVNHVLAADEPSGVDVEVLTLDDLLRGRHAALVKIDVEGFETEVLAGARHALTAGGIGAILIELNGSGRRYGFDDDAIRHDLALHGYVGCAYDPARRELRKIPVSEQENNALYVRDVSACQSRVREAAAVRVLDKAL